jgi:hypothetical protein
VFDFTLGRGREGLTVFRVVEVADMRVPLARRVADHVAHLALGQVLPGLVGN